MSETHNSLEDRLIRHPGIWIKQVKFFFGGLGMKEVNFILLSNFSWHCHCPAEVTSSWGPTYPSSGIWIKRVNLFFWGLGMKKVNFILLSIFSSPLTLRLSGRGNFKLNAPSKFPDQQHTIVSTLYPEITSQPQLTQLTLNRLLFRGM